MSNVVTGFFGMVAVGPLSRAAQVADIKWPLAGFIRAHLWLATFGVLLVAVAYLLGAGSRV